MKIIISLLTTFMISTVSQAADYKCESKQEGLCIRYSGQENDSRFQEIQKICEQNNGQMELGFCPKDQVVGRCLFMDEIVTYYYSYIFNDYDAETTCNYSYGKYKKGFGN